MVIYDVTDSDSFSSIFHYIREIETVKLYFKVYLQQTISMNALIVHNYCERI